ncbi:MAG: ArsR/SmtB family transcription factor [Solirubrobacterales bacterium]
MMLSNADNSGRPLVEKSRRLSKEKLTVMASYLRLGIVTSLLLRPASASELALELGVSVEKVRYHLNRMRKGSLVEVRGKTRRRGVTENLYFAVPSKQLLDVNEAVNLQPRRFGSPNVQALRRTFREAKEAIQEGSAESQPENAIIRLLMPLDEQGRHSATEIQRQLVHEVLSVLEASLGRLQAGEETPIKASAVLMGFERAEDG